MTLTSTQATSSITQSLTELQGVIVGLGAIKRHHYIPQSDRRENVAEHTLSVLTLAWWLHQKVSSQTDLITILKLAIVHDFVEVYAGDVNTFASPADRQAKEVHEQAALRQFAAEFSDFPDMLNHMRQYQLGASAEARFLWTADKIQALVLGQMDDWRTYREQQISLEAFSRKYNEIGARTSPELSELFSNFVEECKQTYPQ